MLSGSQSSARTPQELQAYVLEIENKLRGEMRQEIEMLEKKLDVLMFQVKYPIERECLLDNARMALYRMYQEFHPEFRRCPLEEIASMLRSLSDRGRNDVVSELSRVLNNDHIKVPEIQTILGWDENLKPERKESKDREIIDAILALRKEGDKEGELRYERLANIYHGMYGHPLPDV